MTTIIKPTELDETTKQLLDSLLASTNNVHLDVDYYNVPAPGQEGATLNVLLAKELLVGTNKKNPAHKRVEVFGNALDSGSYGKLINSLGVLQSEKDYNFKTRKVGKEIVIKQIDLTDSDQFAVIEEEKQINQCSDKIKCKPALFNHRYGFLRMTKGKGIHLGDFIGIIELGKIQLSLLQLLQLSDDLITALHEMHQRGSVHRDIKPDNILVDPKNLGVTLIDFDSACEQGPAKELRGNWFFIAPEYVKSRRVTNSLDWFSMGLVLAELWGDRSQYSIKENEFTVRRALEWHQNESFMELFHSMEIPEDIQEKLRSSLKQMIRCNPETRYQYEQMHEVLTGLIKQVKDPGFDQEVLNRNCIRKKGENPAPASFGF